MWQDEIYETPWLVIHKKNPRASVRLICFHYGGGSASAYRNWPEALPDNIELCAIQLPGREKRFSEEYFSSFPSLTRALCRELSRFTDKPYFVFGHSLGAIVSFEWLHGLQKDEKPMPLLYFPSGMPAPNLYRPTKLIGRLPEESFVEELMLTYGENLGSILLNKDMRDVFMPQLRADFNLLESYQFNHSKPLDCNICALAGIEEFDISTNELNAWGNLTMQSYSSNRFKGGHFFIHEEEAALLSFIGEKITAFLSKQSSTSVLSV